MSWHPNDLVADQDLADYEVTVLTQFGAASFLAKRTKALEDWILPIVKANGFDPHRLRTRFEPTKVFGYTASAFGDYTTAAQDTTADDINLGTVLATPGSDALYVGSIGPFRGLHLRMLDSVSAVSGAVTVAYWNDAWTSLPIIDGTEKTSGKSFSGGGSITWPMVADWAIRPVNGSDALYWVKVTVNATPTSAKASQIGCIRRSALCAPAALRTLMLIFKEASTGQDGPWKEKATYYEAEADAAMQRALPILGGEFDTAVADTPSDLIDAHEATQTAEEAGAAGFRWERG